VLKYNGIAVTVNQLVTTANIGLLTLDPVANYDGTASFDWNGYDGVAYAVTDKTLTVLI